MSFCFHKWDYISHHHLECMPNDEKGISLYFRCKKCGKEKYKVYMEKRSNKWQKYTQTELN